jgi:tRNA pseudouridine55 synthase
VDEACVREVVASFLGEIEQVPPMYSALKHDGRPLYELARQGVEVERKPRRVVLHRLEVSNWTGSRFDLAVACSKGTYIRSLAADVGARLGCGAHLAALRRTRIDRLAIADAVLLNSLEAASPQERLSQLLAADSLLLGWPAVTLTASQTVAISHGQSIAWAAGGAGTRCRLYGAEGRFLGVGETREGGRLVPQRLVNAT